jgi:predicted dehydrogenase
MNRRQFLSGAAGLITSASAFAEPFQDQKPKRVGLIGCGWYGKVDLLRLIQVSPVEVVSLCDVDKKTLADAAEIVASRQVSKKKPRTFADYRQMIAEKDLDIVLVGTPDHWHALPAIAAMKAGADVWCQKPISVDVTEAHAMFTAARKYKRVVQIGTQRRSTPHLVDAINKVIKEGKLGNVALIETYNYGRSRVNTSPDEAPPETLDYEFWTGPAPMKPYVRGMLPRSWRAYMEYGNGTLGDMGIHMFDMVRWMMGLGWPKRISSSGGLLVLKGGKSNIPDTQIVTFDYDNVKVMWQHRNWGGPAPDPNYSWGATLYGDKGTLKASVYRYDYTPVGGSDQPIHQDVVYELDQYPEDKTERDLERHTAPAVRYQMKDFLNAIATRGRPVADIEEGYISTASCILGNVAMKLGRTLEWDPKTHRVVNDAEANRLLTRPYRSPWVHPTPENV